jgi:hypothetical protein
MQIHIHPVISILPFLSKPGPGPEKRSVFRAQKNVGKPTIKAGLL